MNSQRGGAVLGMVMMVLLLGAGLLNLMRRQQEALLWWVADDQYAVKGAHQAQSALAWGMTLRWETHHEWFCQTETHFLWRVCLLQFDDNLGLLQGTGMKQKDNESIVHWQWVTVFPPYVRPAAHGWVDYCPLREDQWQCVPDAN